MIVYGLLPGLVLLAIAFILMAKFGKLDGFPAGILVLTFSMLCSIALGNDPIPIDIGAIGFAILGSLGVVQMIKRKKSQTNGGQ
jgi:hypothetical protein